MHAGSRFAALRLALRFACLTLLLAALLAPRAHAQASVYGGFTASKLAGGPAGDYLYGGTLGLLVDGPSFFNRAVLSADVQTRDVALNGERLLSATIGPRVSVAVPRFRLTPYAEFLIGFGRYRSGTTPGSVDTTDSLWTANVGASHPLNSRLDLTADYGYSQYGYDDGQFNPKYFSAGLVFDLIKR